MYEVPPDRGEEGSPAAGWRGGVVALGLLLLGLLGLRYWGNVVFAGAGVDEPAFAARALSWQAWRYRECWAYAILLFCILLSARERARRLTLALLAAAGLALVYFELVMLGLVPFAQL